MVVITRCPCVMNVRTCFKYKNINYILFILVSQINQKYSILRCKNLKYYGKYTNK